MAKNLNKIYPLTIVRDRYSGTYSGGSWLAYNKYPWQGVGYSLEEAIADLSKKLE